MGRSLLLQFIGTTRFKILDFLTENKSMDYSKKDIAEGANISRASLFNYWPELENQNIVKPTRRFGKTQLFTLNSTNVVVKKILELEATLIKQAMKKRVLVSA
jgi:hypothetical protein|tara:strand:+ start:497 stop:805 length:309 start_codon:yes stop_codon:yes gene_type:complete